MVEKDQDQPLIGRHSAKGLYDKGFIADVLEQIYSGMPRRQACAQYMIHPATLKYWIKSARLGIVSGLDKPVSIQFKRSVVRAVESGRLSIKEAQRTYSIGAPVTIKRWIEQFKQENDELGAVNGTEMNKKKPSKGSSTSNDEDIKTLQKALEEAQLKIAALNTLIDVAEEQLKINIRKKSGAKQSND